MSNLLSITPNKYDISDIKRKYHHLFIKIATFRNMEDKLICIDAHFVDSSSGEVISHSKNNKPLSIISDDDVLRLFHSFMRGIRQDKKIAVSIYLYADRDLPTIVEQKLIF